MLDKIQCKILKARQTLTNRKCQIVAAMKETDRITNGASAHVYCGVLYRVMVLRCNCINIVFLKWKWGFVCMFGGMEILSS